MATSIRAGARQLDPSLYLPAYSYADAGRYAQISARSVRRWFHGMASPGHSMVPVFSQTPEAGLSYVQLVEVAFVAAMRRRHLTLRKIRNAYDFVRDRMSLEYPFVQERFRTDGIDLFVDALDEPDFLLTASGYGQMAWRMALERSANAFDYEDHLALSWHPRGRDFQILIDPRISFGMPVIEGTGVPTASVRGRYSAGENLDFIAEDFGLSREQVKDALSFENANLAA